MRMAGFSAAVVAAMAVAVVSGGQVETAREGRTSRVHAPRFPAGATWFNVERPLTLADLRGKVVLLDFWTSGCINCIQVIPDLERLEADFPSELVVIGVHSAKFAEEGEPESVRNAVRRLGLTHPVINDPQMRLWTEYGVRAWPTLVLVDPEGYVAGSVAGEGHYQDLHAAIARLVDTFGKAGTLSRSPLPVAPEEGKVASGVLRFPGKLLADAAANRLFVSDSGHFRLVEVELSSGKVLRTFGSGKAGFADGPALEASFADPQGLARRGDTLYVADRGNHAVRAIDLTRGVVSTVAGTGQQADWRSSGVGKALDVALASPWDLALDGHSLYVAMAGLHQIFRIDLTSGSIAPFAGDRREGLEDGPRRLAQLAQPSGLAVAGEKLYFADPESSSIRWVGLGPDGAVHTLVGTGLFDFGDRDGVAGDVRLQHALGVAVLGAKLVIADTYNNRIKILDPAARRVITLAGDGTAGLRDGIGSAARFDAPGGVSVAGGKIYVADTSNDAVRVIDPKTAEVRTIALEDVARLAPSTATMPVRTLATVTLAPGHGTIDVALSLPPHHHVNLDAPSRVEATSSGPAVAVPSAPVALGTTGGALGVDLREGDATVELAVRVFYCREGANAVCLIHAERFTLPVHVAPGGATAARVSVSLPGS